MIRAILLWSSCTVRTPSTNWLKVSLIHLTVLRIELIPPAYDYGWIIINGYVLNKDINQEKLGEKMSFENRASFIFSASKELLSSTFCRSKSAVNINITLIIDEDVEQAIEERSTCWIFLKFFQQFSGFPAPFSVFLFNFLHPLFGIAKSLFLDLGPIQQFPRRLSRF